MRLLVALVVACSLAAVLSASSGLLCWYQSEEVTGLNKICYYSCPSGGAAITLKSYQLCPLSISR